MTPQQIELALETIALVLEDLKKTQEKQQATITAIKGALAEHAMREVQRLGQEIEQAPEEHRLLRRKWFGHRDTGHLSFTEAVDVTMKKIYSQPKQEPVAWMDADGNVSNNNDHKCFPIPLYTHPPQRTWVGLNDDEIDYLIHLAYTGDEEFVQTIEAKLKEKNLPCIKPKWIGLTEKEHTDIAVECGCMSADWVFYGAAVERKLKEKNT